MAVPQVSPQALLNEAERHKSWESLEACLTNLLTTGQVLDFKHNVDHVSVQLNGTTNPVKLMVRAPVKAKESAAVAVAEPEPVKTVKLAAKNTSIPAPTASLAASKARIEGPVGVVALVGFRTENYSAHVRKLIRFALECHLGGSGKLDADIESCAQDWFKAIQ